MKNYGVFGNPIEHSLSPQIHSHFAKQFDIQLNYTKILTDNFTTSAIEFINNNGDGFNVTVPFKTAAYDFATHLNQNAIQAKAVNTIKIIGDKIIGDNTDGIGLTTDLTNNIGLNLQDKIILILGSGGASRGIIPALLQHKPKRIMIANRTVSTAINLAHEFATLGPTCGFGFEKVKETAVDLVINATSSSIDKQTPNITSSCVRDAICYDLMYGKQTAFMDWAIQSGAKAIFDGWGMLVEQAAKSFELWFDKKPDTTFLLNNKFNH